MKSSLLCVFCLVPGLVAAQSPAKKIFSGPQIGEETTPFKGFDVDKKEEIDYIKKFAGAPTTLVFVHGIERSMVPLMSVVDMYCHQKRDAVRALFVFLSDDRVESERRVPVIRGAVGLRIPAVVSVDGLEGPGNYGLNKECLLTIVVAKENRVTANFALVQPGIADGAGVIGAIAKVIGDENPPSAEELNQANQARRGGDRRMRRERQMRQRARQRPEFDLSRFDLESKEGLREAVRALATEVRALRRELAEVRKPEDPRRRPGVSPRRPGRDRPSRDENPRKKASTDKRQ